MSEYTNGVKIKSGYFLFFLSTVFLFLVAFRLLYSNPIEFNDESILKWQLGRAIFETQDWSLLIPTDEYEAHHELRWAVVIPEIILAAFFSTGYLGYYVTPVLFFCLFTTLAIGFYGRANQVLLYGVLLALVISFEPMGHVMASQVNTGAFGLLYVIIAFWCVVKYFEKGGLEKIFFCSLFSFFAYGAHISYLVFWAAPATFLVINKKDYRAAFFFLFFLSMFYVMEIWILNIISQGNAIQNRFERIWDSKFHFDSEQAGGEGAIRFRGGELLRLSHFFYRWWLIPKYDFLILIGFLLCSISVLTSRVRKSLPVGVWLCFYGASIYGLAVSFPIINFTPRLSLALDLHSRYLAPFFPLASVFVVWLVYFFANYSGRIAQRLVPVTLILALSSTFFVGTAITRCFEEVQDINSRDTLSGKTEAAYCKIFRYSQEQNIYPTRNAFVFRAEDYYRDFNEDYITGKVALFGASRIGVFRAFVRVQYPNAKFIETENGWYSIDGEEKDQCVIELGQTETAHDNYRNCIGKKMERGIFN